MYCEAWPDLTYFYFTSHIPSLMYYSHIPTSIAALIIGMFVFFNDSKSILNKLLFLISVTFSVWCLLDLTLWVNPSSQVLMLIMSILAFLTPILFLLTIYFVYVYVNNGNKKNTDFKVRILLLGLLMPFTLFSFGNAYSFDLSNCLALPSEIFDVCTFIFELFIMLLILVLVTHKYRSSVNAFKPQIFFLSIGAELFLFSFFLSGSIVSYLLNQKIINNFSLDQYGLFGVLFFIAFLTFLIVKFKAFNIKLLGAQALMWAIAMLVGSQLFFIKTKTNYILTSTTLIITIIAGYILVRSVKKVDEQKELLEVANNNQQLLIRFITHQVKGFFTKSKMIFAALLEGDFGDISNQVKDVSKIGLDSDNDAVKMVQDVLNAANLKSGTMKFDFEKTELNGLVTTLAEDFRKTATASGLKYDIVLPEEKLFVIADKTQLTQVIKNLIDNSIKYTQTGFVKVSLEKVKVYGNYEETSKDPQVKAKSGYSAIFKVSDSGVGLTDDDKHKLFTEGGRGAESVKVNVTSTGYGLFIVKKIVEAHNGHISATSQGRDKGSTFSVELPLI